ncbi:PIN domain-containing protein [Roseicella aquatilis]|uniref:PIN domain-containing protein n=1 Tax=Roseicella aquatilis TaxID=2527868 RepID=A0A4R4D8S7_9PROT|nr:PIN domain-containing protein [Roseicella aquatilis]TCZ56747.1 PIN domain-containing protein [Roseicella aquatilis]
MSHPVLDPPPVLVDACALVGPAHRAAILAAAAAAGLRLAWSARILAEAEHGIARMLAARPEAVPAARAALRAALAGSGGLMVEEAALPPGLPRLPDPGDAHVLAAALAAGARLILTENRRHFPPRLLGPLGLRALRTDDWLAEVPGPGREAALLALARLRPEDRPAAEHLAVLRRSGLPRCAALLARLGASSEGHRRGHSTGQGRLSSAEGA